MIGFVAFFVPPIFMLGLLIKDILSDRKAFFSNQAVGWFLAIVSPIYPFLALTVLVKAYSDEGKGMFTAFGGAVIYYPVVTILFVIYAFFAEKKLPAGVGILFCLLPILVAFMGGFSGISPH